jgi:hypothetical protein
MKEAAGLAENRRQRDINAALEKALASDPFISLTVSEECATLGKILSL